MYVCVCVYLCVCVCPQDEEAALLAELERIKKERAEEARKKVCVCVSVSVCMCLTQTLFWHRALAVPKHVHTDFVYHTYVYTRSQLAHSAHTRTVISAECAHAVSTFCSCTHTHTHVHTLTHAGCRGGCQGRAGQAAGVDNRQPLVETRRGRYLQHEEKVRQDTTAWCLGWQYGVS